MEKVEVILCISGDYCAFHEMSFKVEYDLTNDIQLGYDTLSELKKKLKKGYTDYSDYDTVEAIKDGDQYYVKLH
jgi:hypothetical protein